MDTDKEYGKTELEQENCAVDNEKDDAETLFDEVVFGETESVRVSAVADDCVIHGDNIAVENDWLEMRYVKRQEGVEEKQRKKADKEKKPHKEKSGFKFDKNFFTAKRVTAAVCVLLVVVALGVFLIGDNAWSEDFKKAALTVFGAESPINTMDLSATTDIADIENGDVIVKSGRLALTLSDGVVANVTESSVSVQLDQNTVVVYSNLKDITAVSGQVVKKYDIIGRYEEMSVINVYFRGVKITDIVEAGRQLIWQV